MRRLACRAGVASQLGAGARRMVAPSSRVPRRRLASGFPVGIPLVAAALVPRRSVRAPPRGRRQDPVGAGENAAPAAARPGLRVRPPGLRDSWRRNDGRTWAPFARLPLTVVQRLKSVGRLQRRLWRAAIHHVVPLSDGALVVFGYRAIYRLDASGGCVGVSPLRGSPPLCLCVDRDIVYYGEYRANRERSPVHVWASRDRGATWTAAIPTGSSTATRR